MSSRDLDDELLSKTPSHEAETLNCPSCGAPVLFGARLCRHCQAELATVRCAECFALERVGSKHCSKCSALLGLEGFEGPFGAKCPRCGDAELVAVQVGEHRVGECMRCTGLFVEHVVLEHITRQSEAHAGLRLRPLDPAPSVSETTKYLLCPRCATHMNRRGFADRSGVIVDICVEHGVWFDRDELARVIEFIEAGGLQQAAERERRSVELRRLQQGRRSIDPSTLQSYDMVGSFLRSLLSGD
jgi:Zn-finger nucleic acid-binding protein